MAEEFWILDRLEDPLAVLESASGDLRLTLPRAWLPRGIREGDVLRLQRSAADGESQVAFCRDEAETERRRQAIRERAARLRKADPGGNIQL
jgi:hypothetical protein